MFTICFLLFSVISDKPEVIQDFENVCAIAEKERYSAAKQIIFDKEVEKVIEKWNRKEITLFRKIKDIRQDVTGKQYLISVNNCYWYWLSNEKENALPWAGNYPSEYLANLTKEEVLLHPKYVEIKGKVLFTRNPKQFLEPIDQINFKYSADVVFEHRGLYLLIKDKKVSVRKPRPV